MKSTGEIMGLDVDYSRALYKAMVASGIGVPNGGSMIATIADSDKAESVAIIREFAAIGFQIFGTAGTARFLQEQGIDAKEVRKLHEGEGNIVDLIKSGQIALLINTLSSDKRIEREAPGSVARRSRLVCLPHQPRHRPRPPHVLAAQREAEPYASRPLTSILRHRKVAGPSGSSEPESNAQFSSIALSHYSQWIEGSLRRRFKWRAR